MRTLILMLLTGLVIMLAILLAVQLTTVPQDQADAAAGPMVYLCYAPATDARQGNLRAIYDAIWMVESGCQLHPRDGDQHRAIGPYQVHYQHWFDATHDTSGHRIHPGTYQMCRNKAYAERVMLWYWQRYCPDALARGNPTVLASYHHELKSVPWYIARFRKAWIKVNS